MSEELIRSVSHPKGIREFFRKWQQQIILLVNAKNFERKLECFFFCAKCVRFVCPIGHEETIHLEVLLMIHFNWKKNH